MKQERQQGGVPITDASFGLRLAGFVGDSIVDGPGLRCVIFAQGCPHHCPGCHNPQTHSFDAGHWVTLDALMDTVHGFPLCKGVTFSGGEPFCQAEALGALAQRLKAEGYELAAYTGYTWEELRNGDAQQQHFLSLLDVLIDGRYEQRNRTLSLRFRGSGNQRIIHVPQSLQWGIVVEENSARWIGGQNEWGVS